MSNWDKGTRVEIERLGTCTAYRKVIDHDIFQWKIKHGFVTVIGDRDVDNVRALDNALVELKKKFKTILN